MVIKDNRKRLEEVEKFEADEEIEDAIKYIKLESHGSDVFNDEIQAFIETIVLVTDEIFYSSSEEREGEGVGDEDGDVNTHCLPSATP